MLSTRVVILIFFFSLFIHLFGLNKIGRTWDEQFKVDRGHLAYDRIAALDFSHDSWKSGNEHPMVAKYIYGFFVRPHMTRVDDGKGKMALLPADEVERIKQSNYIFTAIYDKAFAVDFDLTFPRFASALFNTFAVVLTFFIGVRLLGKKFGWVPSLFLLFMPRFVVMGQLITFESISVFLFCLTFLLFDRLLAHPKKIKYFVFTGLLTGLLFWTRYNNAYIFLFLGGWLILHAREHALKKLISWRFILIPFIAFLLGIVIWPYLWSNFIQNLWATFVGEHTTRGIGPSMYYIQQLLITTPLPILFGLVLGVFKAFQKRAYWDRVFLWWLFSSLLFFTLVCVPMGGTRYIIVMYPVIAILASYGYVEVFKKSRIVILSIILVLLCIEMMRFHPYYLDYYNQFVGGPRGAAEKGYEFSWWGEGQREVGLWINVNIPDGRSVGLIVRPKYVFPRLREGIKHKGYVDDNTDADYVVVSRSEVASLSQEFRITHTVVYSSQIDGEPLVLLYEKIRKDVTR